jgi:membrane protease YdiL (CAAX protease family)
MSADTPKIEHASWERDLAQLRRAGLVIAVGGASAAFLGRALDVLPATVYGGGFAVIAVGLLALIGLFPRARPYVASLHPRVFFLETWRELDAEAAAAREKRKEEGKGYDYRPLIALAFGAVCLALMEYFGQGDDLFDLVEWWSEDAHDELRDSRWFELSGHAYWALWRVLGYFVLPAVAMKLTGERLRDNGLETKGFREHAWIYALGFYCVVVLVGAVSFEESFQDYYPFYRGSRHSWLDFGIWEVLYAAQFFSLEFFFRGWWLRSMRAGLGSHAIFAMVVPYCMIHFGKPFPETLAAIAAGVFLGTLAMKTRSIWSGFLIHVSVAISMDLAALFQNGNLPTEWLPPP